jgi:hypothetical protein
MGSVVVRGTISSRDELAGAVATGIYSYSCSYACSYFCKQGARAGVGVRAVERKHEPSCRQTRWSCNSGGSPQWLDLFPAFFRGPLVPRLWPFIPRIAELIPMSLHSSKAALV